MQALSQEFSIADEMPTFDQVGKLFPNEELFIGDNSVNNIDNSATFDADLMVNWQEPTSFDQSLQLPLDQGFFTGIYQPPTTQQSWQCTFRGGLPTNHVDYPVFSQSPYPAMWYGEGGCFNNLDPGTIVQNSANNHFLDNHSLPTPVPAYDQHTITNLPATATALPLSNANATAITANPITGRYPCSYPTCAQDFKRPGDRLRHITSVHQRGQTTHGKNLCPIVGCRRSYGRGLCRPDKVNDHLRKIHGLVRAAPAAPAGGSVVAGTSTHGANGVGSSSAAVSETTVSLAGNGN
ncbi:hypothetical protein SBOR_10051 [Sclerotinia borealis F-4128]|uniref:C2H2-type domain-containing protein n=1 Tax=Sclerotinia borealis (strain F-4128) TaxID=1432307 RepID=W9C0X7_SCLBF|nr:hypothetical protein SBOR_10051 [Sclerotinia borealis F-4128]